MTEREREWKLKQEFTRLANLQFQINELDARIRDLRPFGDPWWVAVRHLDRRFERKRRRYTDIFKNSR